MKSNKLECLEEEEVLANRSTRILAYSVEISKFDPFDLARPEMSNLKNREFVVNFFRKTISKTKL